MKIAERRIRGKFRVVDARTGEVLGSYFNDEGYCAIDTDLIRKELPQFEENVRIVKVNWPDYAEVEVFVERFAPNSLKAKLFPHHLDKFALFSLLLAVQ